MRPRAYVAGIVIASAAIIAAVGVSIVAIDPYLIFHTRLIQGFNEKKPYEAGVTRVSKPLMIMKGGFDGIIFGSSLVEQGFDPDANLFKARELKVYNGGLSGMVPHEATTLLSHAASLRPPSFAVIVLEFGRYEAFRLEKGAANLPADWSLVTLLSDVLHWTFSSQALRDAYKTVKFNRSRDFSVQHFPNGRLNTLEYFDAAKGYDYGYAFDYYDKNYIVSFYESYLRRGSLLRTRGFDHGPLREMLNVAGSANIKLYVVVPPYHVRQSEIIHLLGLGQPFERWKTDIACIIDRAEHEKSWAPNGAPEFWDFSTINEVTTERVPAPEEKGTPLRFYFDPVHFRPMVGEAVVAQLLGSAKIDKFGKRLDRNTVYDHLIADRAERAKFFNEHPQVRAKLISLGAPERVLPSSDIKIPADSACKNVMVPGDGIDIQKQ